MSASVRVAAWGPADGPPAAAAVRVHGIYPGLAEARAAVRALAEDDGDEDVAAYVLDDVGRWLPMAEPGAPDARVAGDEVEDVGGAENDDPSRGRCGSVCHVRRPCRAGGPATVVAGPDAGPPAAAAAPDAALPGAAPPTARAREARRQQRQLEDLLHAAPPSAPPADPAAYAALRAQCATLCAFRRKLERLRAESATLCERSAARIAELDAAHPEYADRYLDHYRRALQQVGLRPEEVPLVRYLGGGPA